MIKFAKVSPEAKIPTKEKENAGYDLYACFPENWTVIFPHEIKLVPLGIVSAFDAGNYFRFAERGSTGSILLEVRAGVVDSGFRGEWKAFLSNGSNKAIVICKKEYVETLQNIAKLLYMDIVIYPYEKAVCQAIFEKITNDAVVEMSYEDIMAIESIRGTGMVGSSGK